MTDSEINTARKELHTHAFAFAAALRFSIQHTQPYPQHALEALRVKDLDAYSIVMGFTPVEAGDRVRS